MVFTIDEIRDRIQPVAQKYCLRAVFLFGSYARNEATPDSDVDLLIDREGSAIRGMLDMGMLYNELRESIGKEIDLVTVQTLAQSSTQKRAPALVRSLRDEGVQIYG